MLPLLNMSHSLGAAEEAMLFPTQTHCSSIMSQAVVAKQKGIIQLPVPGISTYLPFDCSISARAAARAASIRALCGHS